MTKKKHEKLPSMQRANSFPTSGNLSVSADNSKGKWLSIKCLSFVSYCMQKNIAPMFAFRLYMSVISIVTKSLSTPTLFKMGGGGGLLMKHSLYKTYPT